MKGITIPNDPYAKVCISQAMVHNGLVYVSGQTAYNEEGKFEGGDFVSQADRSFRNLKKVLEASGSSLGNVIKVSIFLRDMATNFSHIIELRKKWFSEPYPADTIVEVVSLWRHDVLVEIEAIAAVIEEGK